MKNTILLHKIPIFRTIQILTFYDTGPCCQSYKTSLASLYDSAKYGTYRSRHFSYICICEKSSSTTMVSPIGYVPSTSIVRQGEGANALAYLVRVTVATKKSFTTSTLVTCGLYYKRVTIVIDTPSVVKVMLQIVASLTIVTRL